MTTRQFDNPFSLTTFQEPGFFCDRTENKQELKGDIHSVHSVLVVKGVFATMSRIADMVDR